MEKGDRPKLKIEVEEEKPILTLDDLSKRLRIGAKEIREVELEGKSYKIPSPHAVQNELLKRVVQRDTEIAEAKNNESTPREYAKSIKIIDKITEALKRAEFNLHRMEQFSSEKHPQAEAWQKEAERGTLTALADVETILREESLLNREILREIGGKRPEPEIPQNLVEPDKVLRPSYEKPEWEDEILEPKKDKHTLH